MALCYSQFGLRLCEDGKMRISMHPLAYKGPRIGDFIADTLVSGQHGKFTQEAIQDISPIRKTVDHRHRSGPVKTLARRSLSKGKKDHIKSNLCRSVSYTGPTIQLLDDSKTPTTDIKGSHSHRETSKQASWAKGSQSLELIAKEKDESSFTNYRSSVVKRLDSSDQTRKVVRRLHQKRPHRALVVQKISRETKRNPSSVLHSILKDRKPINADWKVLPSRRSMCVKKTMLRQPTAQGARIPLSQRRKDLHSKLVRSLDDVSSACSAPCPQRMRCRSTSFPLTVTSVHSSEGMTSPITPQKTAVASPNVKMLL
mmetsp:Transcript_4668/g.6608  ORF Transcript_4668/g.6608 Transcript_4668/m.6608 type:complete len:313 (-) Transcript_4668:294-1232(-)